MRYFIVLTVFAAVTLRFANGQVCSLPSSASQCPNTRSSGCCTWVPEYPNNQTVFKDHTLNFTENDACRPLGFVFSTYYFQPQQGIAQPCARINCNLDGNGQCSEWAIVHIQTNKQLCAEFQVDGNTVGSRICQDSSFSFCRKIPGVGSQVVTVKFFCTSCAESDVSFWYRIITFNTAGQDANDLCPLQPNMFPDDLIQLPAGQDPRNRNPTIAPATTSAASSLYMLSWSLWLAVAFLAYLLH
eukprot:scpid28211/ scgid28127/ 